MNTTLKHHPTLSPSKLDILAVCPLFQNGPVGDAAKKGTAQHLYAEALLRGDEAAAKEAGAKIESGDRENVEWYVDYVHATASGDLEIEQHLELLGPNFEQITFGTIDAGAGVDIFDYKSDREEREHTRQMAAYALMRIRQKGLERVTAHICYGKFHKVVKHTFTEVEAWDLVEATLAIYYNPQRQAMPCEYCGWCANATTCTALTKHVAVVMGNIAPDSTDKIIVWEPSAMSDPATVSRALNVARIVGAWADAVEKHAKIMMEGGNVVPGWAILERAGARQIKDVTKAFQLSGLSELAFLKACKIGIGDLEEQWSIEKGIKKAAAKREVNSVLADVISNKKPFKLLVKEKE